MIHFEDTFPAHLFIEMCYGRKNKWGLIYEQKLNRKKFKLLCETYGVFDGCYKLAEEILFYIKDKIPTAINNDFYIFIKNSNFIDKIRLITYNGDCASYEYEESKIVNGKFSPLTITIGVVDNEKNILSSIMHELTHAYEDYKRYMNNAISLTKKAKNVNYAETVKGVSSYDELKSMLSYLLYFLNEIERNAFITEMDGLLSLCNQKFHNIQEVLNFIRETKPYSDYQQVFELGEMICNVTDKLAQYYILTRLKEISNHKFTTYNQFVKWLSNKIYKFQRKFNEIIPKMAAQHLNMTESFAPSSHYFNLNWNYIPVDSRNI